MHLKLTIYFLLFITITDSLSSDWEKFKSDYNKQYESPAEEAQRQQIFLENVNRIKEYQTTHPDATFTMGINHLTDQRIEELVFGSKSFVNLHSETNEEPIEVKAIIPTRLDWRYENVTTSVYNQSAKISAPAIAAVEVIESYQAIQTKNLVRGSVNQVSVCCGNTIDVFDCILSKLGGGICSEIAYNLSTSTCNRNACEPFIVFSSIKKLELAKEATMLEWIQDSPLYIGIDASQITFQTYESGIYLDMNCSKTDVNHVLQLVGYGFQSGIPYWLCKNSWGEGWGEQGYIRIERGRNVCGIATYVVQIENKNIINNAVRLLTFNGIYLALFCLFVYIFVILK